MQHWGLEYSLPSSRLNRHPCLSRLTGMYLSETTSCISHLPEQLVGGCSPPPPPPHTLSPRSGTWESKRSSSGVRKQSCKGIPAQMSPEKCIGAGSWEDHDLQVMRWGGSQLEMLLPLGWDKTCPTWSGGELGPREVFCGMVQGPSWSSGS